MVKIVATQTLPYGSKRYSAGEEFDATERDARLLVKIGRAAHVQHTRPAHAALEATAAPEPHEPQPEPVAETQEAAPEAQPSPRQYNRRDMTAGTGWPDWSGQAVAIVASGPSTKGVDLNQLRGRLRVVAIKENINLCPWADLVYGCDAAWWRHRNGLPKFKGLKVAWSGAQVDYPDLLRVEIARNRRGYADTILFGEVGKVGGGGNSGFQALNLVAQLRANRILLIGFDMNDGAGAHWYGRNTWHAANNPDETAFRRWRPALEAAAPVLAARGIDVVNASPVSTLKGFRRATVPAALEQWGLT